jgi:hypothetical protein
LDTNKFDRLTATLGVISTRRLVLGGLVAALAGALGSIAPRSHGARVGTVMEPSSAAAVIAAAKGTQQLR